MLKMRHAEMRNAEMIRNCRCHTITIGDIKCSSWLCILANCEAGFVRIWNKYITYCTRPERGWESDYFQPQSSARFWQPSWNTSCWRRKGVCESLGVNQPEFRALKVVELRSRLPFTPLLRFSFFPGKIFITACINDNDILDILSELYQGTVFR